MSFTASFLYHLATIRTNYISNRPLNRGHGTLATTIMRELLNFSANNVIRSGLIQSDLMEGGCKSDASKAMTVF